MTITPERASRTMSDLIAEEIRVALTRQRTSQRQFAAKLGVSPAWLNYRLTGVQEIGVNDLKRIADALGLGVYDLLPSPEAAAQAATIRQDIPRYLDLTVRTDAHVARMADRPPDNRPSGKGGSSGPTRTAFLSRRGPGRNG